MKTVARATWIHEADNIRMRLNSFGIEAFIPDEGIVTANPMFGNAVGGIRIQVRDEDFDEAREVLGYKGETPGKSDLVCPKCASNNVVYEKMSRKVFFVGLLLLGIPFLYFKKRFSCRDCRTTWK